MSNLFSTGGAGNVGASEGIDQQSLKFNDDESQYLSWTPAAAGNRKTWTWSGWVKRGNIDSVDAIFSGGSDTSNFTTIKFLSTGELEYKRKISGSNDAIKKTNAVFRDPSAWYHIVLVEDAANTTASIYVNGVQQSLATDDNPSNVDGFINATNVHQIGDATNSSELFDGYLSDVYFIDGQALDASSFGETVDGYWKAKDYAGTYGTNGFHLTFADDVVSEGFNAVTYVGNGTSQSVSGLGLAADLVWIKNRDTTESHTLFDTIRGAGERLFSNLTSGDNTASNSLTSFDADGFSVGSHSGVNTSGHSNVAWSWDAGSGSPVSNTDGSITSSVKANPDYGFSITSFVGNGTLNATTGHGLSSTPEMVLVKNRSTAVGWLAWHKDLSGATYRMDLNGDGAEYNDGNGALQGVSSSLLTLGSLNAVNQNSANMIAYCWHSVAGYSSFGSYSGNGSSTGPTVTGLGFDPSFVMVKRTDGGTGSWMMYDNTRYPVNTRQALAADLSLAESSITGDEMDFITDGFQPKSSNGIINASGGTYIYMAFADTREAAFWKDVSGQGNHWTPNNLDYRDSVIDSPANNFATWNPLIKSYSSQSYTLQEGNLEVNDTSSGGGWGLSTIPLTSGKWYWEAEIESVGTTIGVGWTTIDNIAFGYNGCYANSDDVNDTTGSKVTDLTTYTVGDIIGIAADVDTGKIWFAKNGSWLASGNPFSGTNPVITFTAGSASSPTFCLNNASGTKGFIANFGQDSTFAGARPAGGNQDDNNIGDFAYAPPSGYLALCTANLPTPTIVDGSEHFNTVLYTGTGTSQSITGVGFGSAPDFVWLKGRSYAEHHHLYDTIRGATEVLYSNRTVAEASDTLGLTSFDSDGFSIGSRHEINNSGDSFVGWNWKAGGTAVSNTAGSITSQVSANTDAGFSVVSWTGNATAGATVGHGLGVQPSMIITKNRDNGSEYWSVYHKDVGNTAALFLNSTGAAYTSSAYWNNTSPTSSVFSIGSNPVINESGSGIIAYCFANSDIIKAGSYTGNGSSDGPFIYTGFRPAFIMTKRTDSTGSWEMYDSKRIGYNAANHYFYAQASNAEASDIPFDILSNGFKRRSTGGSANASGGTYIFMAFAENPFKYANAR